MNRVVSITRLPIGRVVASCFVISLFTRLGLLSKRWSDLWYLNTGYRNLHLFQGLLNPPKVGYRMMAVSRCCMLQWIYNWIKFVYEHILAIPRVIFSSNSKFGAAKENNKHKLSIFLKSGLLIFISFLAATLFLAMTLLTMPVSF